MNEDLDQKLAELNQKIALRAVILKNTPLRKVKKRNAKSE